jgi:hypothetical protein
MTSIVPSDYYLERYALGELPAEEAGEIERRAAADPAVRAALNEIKSSNRAILSLYPPAMVASRLAALRRESGGRPLLRFRRLFFLSSAAAAAAAALLVVFLVVPSIKKPETDLIKGLQNVDLGRTQLLVFRMKDAAVEILPSGARARAGDLLQLAYVASKAPYGLILSIDGLGRLTLHFPERKDGPADLKQNTKAVLPDAIELDDAPGFERFFLITSNDPIAVPEILARAENLASDPARIRTADLDLPPGCRQFSVLILKGEDP